MNLCYNKIMNYLLALQSLRESSPDFINAFFMLVSDFVQNIGFLIPACIYWCVSKAAGTTMFLCYSSAFFSNQLIKNTACVYRPWIRWPELHPYSKAVKTATGYSFPSGHSVSAAVFYGSMAVNQKKKKWVVALMITLVILTAFSRNWLGAHTFQDVMVAVVEGFFFIALFEVLKYWFSNHQDKDVLICIIGIVLTVVGLLYLQFKPYPMDYLNDGKLLVDPYDMITDCYTGAGLSMAALLGWFLDRRFIHYEAEGNWKRRLICFLCGAFLILGVKIGLHILFKPVDAHLSHIIQYFILGLTTNTIYPLIVLSVRRRLAAKKA